MYDVIGATEIHIHVAGTAPHEIFLHCDGNMFVSTLYGLPYITFKVLLFDEFAKHPNVMDCAIVYK